MNSHKEKSLNDPVLTIITVCYNAAEIIEDTIQSVFDQTYSAIEYIVIDGKSTDDTFKILSENKDMIDQLISEVDTGIYNAMNKGLKLATGDFVLFLNAGDLFNDDEVVANLMINANHADIIYGETNLIDGNGQVLGTRSQLTTRKLPEQLKKSSFLNGQPVSHQSFIARTILSPAFDEKYKCSSDIDWMLKIVSKAKKVVNVNQVIARYQLGGDSDTKLKLCWKERLFILLKHFPFHLVVLAHVKFAIRFMFHGAYKKKDFSTS